MLNQLGGHAWIEISRKSVGSMDLLWEIFWIFWNLTQICGIYGSFFLRLRDVGFFAICEVFFGCDQNFFPGEDSYLVNENGGAKYADEDEQGASPKG